MARRHGQETDLVEGDELERIRLQLVEWRRHHNAPTPIPSALWSGAVKLAKRYGIGQTARVLRLDYASLKRRMTTSVMAPTAPAEFIELLAPVSGGIAECALEIESSRGARMRVLMKNVSPAGLASIIRDFAG